MLEKLPEALGHALRHRRAGLEKIAANRVDFREQTGRIEVSSPVFVDHGPIPSRYTADGRGLSPPLKWALAEGTATGAASLLLIVEDADSPTSQPLVHAIVFDFEPQDGELPEGALRSSDHPGSGLRTGQNSYLQEAWLPPDPPPGHGPHRYAFQVFTLSAGPPLSESPGREEVIDALRERGLASGLVIGTYERDSRVADRESEEGAEGLPRDALVTASS